MKNNLLNIEINNKKVFNKLEVTFNRNNINYTKDILY